MSASAIDAAQSFPPVAQSARAARRFVGDSLADRLPASAVEVAVLLTSELVSNAVMHAGPHPPGEQLGVRVRRSSRRVRIEVSDHGGGVPSVAEATADGHGGRGLMLVAALSSAWGVEPDGSGKVVWFELDG